MTNVRVARRYAEALVELAENEKNVDATIKDLELLKASIKDSRQLLVFLKSPVVGHSRKRDVLLALFEGKIQKSTLNSVAMITLKGREDLLPEIINEFFNIWDDRQGIVRVDVRTATDFSTEQTAKLQGKLEQYTNKKVRISFGHDAELVGGFVARVGDTVFDASVRRQLELLRKRLSQVGGLN